MYLFIRHRLRGNVRFKVNNDELVKFGRLRGVQSPCHMSKRPRVFCIIIKFFMSQMKKSDYDINSSIMAQRACGISGHFEWTFGECNIVLVCRYNEVSRNERERHLFTSHNTAHKKGHITKVFTYIETVCVMKG